VSSYVLDASAFLAYLYDESGASVVEAALLQGSAISVINWIEVLSKVAERGKDPQVLLKDLETQGLLGQNLEVMAVAQVDTVARCFADTARVAQLRPLTKSIGLSLGDRACIALGQRLGLPILTGDQVWAIPDNQNHCGEVF
jgi:ribonuclease VapC